MLNQLLSFFRYDSSLLPYLFLLVSSILGILIIQMSTQFFNMYDKQRTEKNAYPYHIANFIIEIFKTPLIILLSVYILYAVLRLIPPILKLNIHINPIYFVDLGKYVVYFWIILNFLSIGKTRLLEWSATAKNRALNILIPAIINSLQAAVFLIMLNILIPELGLHGGAENFLEKAAKVFLIVVLGWIFLQVVEVLEKFILSQYIGDQPPTITSRKINTQVVILKRVILSVGFIIILASVLMVFDSVKNIGTGLLATAGIASAVGAFASQQSLSRLFSGLQIAFTQPMRIGDTVIIDNESGQVEEITLSYIVVKLWDLRRLIIPTDYFTGRGLQNLTRHSTELLGTIFIYTDYTLPIDEVRKKFHELLDVSPLWDRKTAGLQVTDIKETSMELRALVSAKNASTLWDLRCEIREQLIKYIAEQFPECLSKARKQLTK